jgi:hypothetical protein
MSGPSSANRTCGGYVIPSNKSRIGATRDGLVAVHDRSRVERSPRRSRDPPEAKPTRPCLTRLRRQMPEQSLGLPPTTGRLGGVSRL